LFGHFLGKAKISFAELQFKLQVFSSANRTEIMLSYTKTFSLFIISSNT
jgi:hypothetical protein